MGRGIILVTAVLALAALALADPPPFDWGVATSAYQIEGAAAQGGRKPSIWDTFSKNAGANGVLFYEKYLGDIAIMKQLGVKNFRMSLSWARLIPDGRGEVNKAGVAFYNRVFDALEDAGITPWILLYHWDMPQSIQDEYGGWVSDRIVDDFTAYAKAAFTAFGNRTSKWMTFNEPKNFCFLGYGTGFHAPGVRDYGGPIPWKCVFNVIKTQAAVSEAFRKIVPTGQISIALDSEWAVPFSSSQDDVDAAQRYLDLRLGIFADPIYLGHWPESIAAINSNLPPINSTLSAQLLANKPHFFGINHYTSKYVKNLPGATGGAGEGPTNLGDGYDGPGNKKISDTLADSTWLYVYPKGFGELLKYVNKKYKPTDLVVTENGVDVPGEFNASLPDVLDDQFRIDYFKGYIQAAADAVKEDKIPLSVYFAWSLLDNFEWQNGYTNRFGIVYIDYNDGYKRYLKASAKFLANLFGTWNSDSKPNPGLQAAAAAAPGPAAAGTGLKRLAYAPQAATAPQPATTATSTLRTQSANPMIGT